MPASKTRAASGPVKTREQRNAELREGRKKAAAIWQEVVDDFKKMNEILEAGGDLAVAGFRVTVRQMPAPPAPPPEFPPAAVKAAREAVGASQQVFADLLGASAATVRAWERGGKPPSPMARRLLAEVAADPARWRAKLVPAAIS